MKHRFLSICGIIAPLLFSFTAILGGALRPGYSHMADTISELFSPGSPNKLLLDTLHTTYALLLVLFGIGLLQFVRTSHSPGWLGITGAWLFIAMGGVSILTAAVFYQDPWGSIPTFQGRMHIYLIGLVGLLSLISMVFLALWFRRAGLFPGFALYTAITIVAVLITTAFFMTSTGGPVMGLAERLSALTGFQWTFTLAWLVTTKK